MNKLKYKILFVLCLFSTLVFQACKKEKQDFQSDNRNLTSNRVNSTVRLLNLAGFNQVVAGKDSLTNFIVRDKNAPDYYKYPGTDYFPTDGRLGKIWNLPQDLFDASEQAALKLGVRNFQGAGNMDLQLAVKNDYNNPTDYFLLPTLYMTGQPAVVPVSRGVSSPSKPDHFKIRIVNLSGNITNPGYNSNGALENLTGSVSLAYADGSLVSTETNDISSQMRTSPYIELPYGTYQFRLLMQDGRQMPALGSEQYDFTLIDPASSTIPLKINSSTNLTYAPIQTYQPGGIYTIVIAPQSFNYLINELGETTFSYQNSFQIISDNTLPLNNTYFKIQGANAFSGSSLRFSLDGNEIGSGLAFGKAGASIAAIHGKHKVEAIDASGKVIASAEADFRAAQNYTVWLYPDQLGAAKLLVLSNDLSGSAATGKPSDDATFDRNQYRYFFAQRFLNLCPDEPYLTFTKDNGLAIAPAVNLQPGLPQMELPYSYMSYAQSAYQIMAYRSKPGVVPGSWADDIEVLKSDAFIADRSLYQKASRALPAQEPGIYTIALIGRSSAAGNSVTKPKMIIIKHNK